VEEARGELGCRVAVEPLAETEAATVFPPALRSTKLEPMTLAGAIVSLKIAVTLVPWLTAPAPFAGVTVETVGGVVSGTTVVNDQVKSAARAFPDVSLIPPEPERSVAV